MSAELLKDNATVKWLESSVVLFTLIGGILSILHPELYSLGIDALRKLWHSSEDSDNPQRLREILSIWYTPFSAVSVISNRTTPLHRDTYGRPEWLDILVALGKYEHGRISFPGLGFDYKYNSGTIVAFPGKIFQHGAECEGDRACIAFYM